MLRLRATAEVAAVDHASMLAAVGELAPCWRDLRFDDGVYVDGDGVRREGLRIERGTHARPGARYRVVTLDEGIVPRDGQDGPILTTEYGELLADEADLLRFRTRTVNDGDFTTDVQVHRPAHPVAVDLDVSGAVGGNWLVGGHIRGTVHIALDRLPPDETAAPQVTAEFRHPRATAKAELRIAATEDGRWQVDVDIRVGGRGLARPFAAMLIPMFGRSLRRGFDGFMKEVPDRVDELNAEWAKVAGTNADPKHVAKAWLDEFLADVLVLVPEQSTAGNL